MPRNIHFLRKKSRIVWKVYGTVKPHYCRQEVPGLNRAAFIIPLTNPLTIRLLAIAGSLRNNFFLNNTKSKRYERQNKEYAAQPGRTCRQWRSNYPKPLWQAEEPGLEKFKKSAHFVDGCGSSRPDRRRPCLAVHAQPNKDRCAVTAGVLFLYLSKKNRRSCPHGAASPVSTHTYGWFQAAIAFLTTVTATRLLLLK